MMLIIDGQQRTTEGTSCVGWQQQTSGENGGWRAGGENAWERLGRIETVFVCVAAVSLATPSLKLFCSRGFPPLEETINSSFIVAAKGPSSFHFDLKSKCCKQENKMIAVKLEAYVKGDTALDIQRPCVKTQKEKES